MTGLSTKAKMAEANNDECKSVYHWHEHFKELIANAGDDVADGVDAIRTRIAANQGVVTRYQRHLDNRMTTYERADIQTQRACNNVEEYWPKFDGACNRFEGLMLALQDADANPAHHAGDQGYENKLDTLENIVQERKNRWAKTLMDKPVGTRAGVRPAGAVAAPQQQQQQQQPPRCKVETSLKPDTLTEEFKPSELKQWKRKFHGYYHVSQMQVLDISGQETYIRSCIDEKLLARMEVDLRDDLRIFPRDGRQDEDCWMKVIDKVFKEKYPLTERRHDALTLTQKNGEYFMDFAHRAKEARDEAGINDGMTGEEITAMIYIIGCNDKELKKEFLKMEDPTVQDLERLARNHDRAARSSDTKGTANRAAGHSNNNGGGKNGGKSDGKPNIIKLALEHRPDLKGKCLCCGKADHVGKNCPSRSNLKCSSCNKDGHVAATCLRKELDRVSGSKKEVGGANAIKSQETLPVHNKPPTSNGPAPLANYSAAVTGKAMRVRPSAVFHTFDRSEEQEQESDSDDESLPDLCPPSDSEEEEEEEEVWMTEQGGESEVNGQEGSNLAPKQEEQKSLAPNEDDLPPLVITEEMIGSVRRAQARLAQSTALSRDTPSMPL